MTPFPGRDVFVVGKVLHPAVGGGTVPVFDTFRNFDNGAGKELYGRLGQDGRMVAETNAHKGRYREVSIIRQLQLANLPQCPSILRRRYASPSDLLMKSHVTPATRPEVVH